MINKISELITVFLNDRNIVSDEEYTKIDMVIQQIISIIFILLFTVIFGILFNCLLEILMITVVLNIMRLFSGGMHFNINFCTLFSIIYIVPISYISKITYQYSFYIFLIIIAVTILSITVVPRMNLENQKKTDKYYRNGYIYVYVIIYLVQTICLYFNYLRILNAINFGIISVLLMLINFERVILFMPYDRKRKKKSGEQNE